MACYWKWFPFSSYFMPSFSQLLVCFFSISHFIWSTRSPTRERTLFPLFYTGRTWILAVAWKRLTKDHHLPPIHNTCWRQMHFNFVDDSIVILKPKIMSKTEPSAVHYQSFFLIKSSLLKMNSTSTLKWSIKKNEMA